MSNDKELIALLKEARRIIRSSLSSGLYQDWDRRATKALAVAALPCPVDFDAREVPSMSHKSDRG